MPDTERLLPDLLRDIRGPRKQAQFARCVEVSPTTVSHWEQGKHIPKDQHLQALAKAAERPKEILRALRHAAKHDDYLRNAEGDEPALQTLRIAVAEAKRLDSSSLPSLTAFPAAFQPLTIVVGDKREIPPSTIGDIAAEAASPMGDAHLRQIPPLPNTTKVSDKILLTDDPERQALLRKRFGNTHLLVLGSPSCNLVARQLNASAVFRFAYDAKVEEDLREIEVRGRKRLKGADRNVTPEDADILRDLQHTLDRLKGSGIYDPLQDRHHVFGVGQPGTIDHATISYARNPFAEKDNFIAILVAGLHSMGTMAAVHWLEDARHFRNHRFGGVIRIACSEDVPIWDRVHKGNITWATPDYTPESFRQSITDVWSPKRRDWPDSDEASQRLVEFAKFLADRAET